MIENYETLVGEEFCGSIGSLGIRIQVGGSWCPDASVDPLLRVAHESLDKIKQELIALIKASDPKEQTLARLEREELLGCFSTPIYVEEIPNGYCSDGCCRHRPWFVVTTPVGRIKIGLRKHVIVIDWSDTKGTADSDTLFANEDVTKNERSIHAWSVDKAREYVTAIVTSGAVNEVSS